MLRCFVVVVMLAAVGANEYFSVLDSIRQEEPCSKEGGICTLDCPTDHLAEEKGLCPNQRSMGVECCYGFSVKETRCEKRGGICTKDPENRCRKNLRIVEATDCPEDTVCCPLSI